MRSPAEIGAEIQAILDRHRATQKRDWTIPALLIGSGTVLFAQLYPLISSI